MEQIVSLIDEVLMNHENEATLAQVKKQVNNMMEQFPLYR
jgi:glycine hydroxymethyltransferase